MKLAALILAAAAALSSCAAPAARPSAADWQRAVDEDEARYAGLKAGRREEYSKSHPNMAAAHRKALLAGQVAIGMNAAEVLASWGKPGKINTSVSADRNEEQWIYPGSYLYMSDGKLRSVQQSKEAP